MSEKQNIFVDVNTWGLVSDESQIYTCTQQQGLNGGMAIINENPLNRLLHLKYQ